MTVDAILADSIAASYNALTDISNAVKYSEGDLAVTMSDTCETAFTNTASNLSPVTAARLFDRF